ncbi:MAG: Hsp33 family molecular chaperone HslO [Eubacterium sp.]|nr:Hsp33 family molecular chaperone HslO [Eubacterium sp.]
MSNQDYIVRGTAAQGQIRCFGISSKNLVEEARRRHDCSPVIAAALGRLLSGAAMMGAMMKNEDDLLTLQIDSQGPVKSLVVTADAFGHVKGYAGNPQVDLPPKHKGKLDVSAAVAPGVLTVIKDIGLKEPYSGQVQLVSGEIAEDLTYYFAVSEQTPSAVSLGVLVDTDCTISCAGGFIVQLMPGTEDEIIGKLEETLKETPSITQMLTQGMSIEDILNQVLGQFDLELLEEKREVSFHCNCSKERMTKALISLGSKEIQSILDDGEDVEMNCHFCNSHYVFDREELEAIQAELKSRQ